MLAIRGTTVLGASSVTCRLDRHAKAVPVSHRPGLTVRKLVVTSVPVAPLITGRQQRPSEPAAAAGGGDGGTAFPTDTPRTGGDDDEDAGQPSNPDVEAILSKVPDATICTAERASRAAEARAPSQQTPCGPQRSCLSFLSAMYQPELLPKRTGLTAPGGQGLLLVARKRLETLLCAMQAGAGPADLPADMQVRNWRPVVSESCASSSSLLRSCIPVLGTPRLRALACRNSVKLQIKVTCRSPPACRVP